MESSGWRPAAAHEELVCGEPSVPGGSDTKPERLEHRSVERAARLDVADVDANVIEEPPGMRLLHRAERTGEGVSAWASVRECHPNLRSRRSRQCRSLFRLIAYPSEDRPGVADDGAIRKFERR
jgi:hypothetical protein